MVAPLNTKEGRYSAALPALLPSTVAPVLVLFLGKGHRWHPWHVGSLRILQSQRVEMLLLLGGEGRLKLPSHHLWRLDQEERVVTTMAASPATSPGRSGRA